jgi:hypothetical protein
LLLILYLLSANVVLANPSTVNPVLVVKKNAGISLKDDFLKVVSKGFVTSSKDAYPIQLGAFRLKLNAEALYNEVKSKSGVDAKIIEEDGYYKVRIARLPDQKETTNSGTKADNSGVHVKSSDSTMNYESHMMMKSSDSTMNYESHMMMKSSDSTGNKNLIPSVTPGIFEPTTFLTYTMGATEKAATEVRNFFLIKGDSP